MGCMVDIKHIFSTLLFISIANLVQPQPVTLEGWDFKKGGEDFYPMVINIQLSYTTSATSTPSPEQIYPTYVLSNNCVSDSPGCIEDIRTLFQKAKDIGFNCIRMNKIVAHYSRADEIGQNERRYAIFVTHHTNGTQYKVYLEPGYTDPYSERVFQIFRDVLDLAEEKGLKIILLSGNDTYHKPSPESEPLQNMYPLYDLQGTYDYQHYLTRLAEEIGDHPALMALDLVNEPHGGKYHVKEYDSFLDAHAGLWTKEEVCEVTNRWYEAIKAKAPDLLVTYGGSGMIDMRVWDMAIMRADFYSLHLYPSSGSKQPLTFQQRLDLYQRELYWFGQVCPIPWIIGETGFSARDNHIGNNPTQPPYMDGNETEQEAFIAFSLNLTRACGGSGWSWWKMEDYNYSFSPTNEDVAHQNYFGLMYYGSMSQLWIDQKQVVDNDVIKNFAPGPRPSTPGGYPTEEAYTNPLGHSEVPWVQNKIIELSTLNLWNMGWE